ncbi:MAG: tetrameric acyl-CoA thioesterase [Francisellaceae bacterium]|nr:tetrameric acyl-CoA thioesterase [Francisellaceae bacterium]
MKSPFLKRLLIKLWNFWLPFLGAGIWIKYVSPDYKHVIVILKKRYWTTNIVGTQFGGSIFMMTDPFYMVMLLFLLGKEYIIWDKGATIHFLKPGRTKLTAEFILKQEELEEIKTMLLTQDKIEKIFYVEVKDEENQIVAKVEKLLYIRKKSTLSKNS